MGFFSLKPGEVFNKLNEIKKQLDKIEGQVNFIKEMIVAYHEEIESSKKLKEDIVVLKKNIHDMDSIYIKKIKDIENSLNKKK